MYGTYVNSKSAYDNSYMNGVGTINCERTSSFAHRFDFVASESTSRPDVETSRLHSDTAKYRSTSQQPSSHSTTRDMGNRMQSSHSPLHVDVRHKLATDSSSNNTTSWQSRQTAATVEDLETSFTGSVNRSLPLIKERSYAERPRLRLSTRSTSTLLKTENLRRNSVDSGYYSGGKVHNDSTASSDSSTGYIINNNCPNFAGRSTKTTQNKRTNQVGNALHLQGDIETASVKSRSEPGQILQSRARENPQLLTRRGDNLRDRETVLSDKLRQTTLENNSRTRLHTGERSMISRSPKSCSRKGLVGLQNLGNTCFMNSILQCLSHCKPLRDRLLNGDHLQPNSKSKMKGKLYTTFSDLLKTMWSNKTETAVSPYSFKLQIQRFSPRFVGYEQQDSQEFLRFLLDGLHEDLNEAKSSRGSKTTPDTSKLSEEETSKQMWKKYRSRENSIVTDLFCGQMISILTCTTCSHRSVTFDPFLDLSLPIPQRSYGSSRYYDSNVTLMDCLKLFTKLEDLDGDEKPKCEKCKVRQKCKKQFKFQKFPKILVLHLKRFSGFGYRSKLQTDVDFPLDHLDLSQFSSDSSDLRCAKYKLFAVSNHSGSTYGGHYTAYCRHPESKEWHSFNDSRVSDLSRQSVHGSQAYVLFYEMDDDSC